MKHRESEIQQAFFTLVHYDPYLDGYVWSNPNGGHRHKATAKRMKAEGQMPGVWDVFVAVCTHGYGGMFIEFKVPPQRTAENRLTDRQREFRTRLQSDYRFEVHTDAVEAYKAVLRYTEGTF